MKDTTIFVLLLLVFAAAAVLAPRDTSRNATVAGTFSSDISRVDYKWAYLRPAESDEILDSCMILDNKFTLSGEIPVDGYPCRITYSGMSIESPLELSPRQSIALNISPEPPQDFAKQYEEACLEAIERLDSMGLSRPDSLSQEKNNLPQ